MNIQISEETVDALFKDILRRDYLMVFESMKSLEAKQKLCANSDLELLPFEQEDLEYDRHVLQAFEIIMEYYFGLDWEPHR